STSGGLPTTAVQHSYAAPGAYRARVTVSDATSSRSEYHDVTVVSPEPLRADAGDDQFAVTGASVRLDGSASRPTALIDGCEWDFGDGSQGTGSIAHHTYETQGIYTARLTVHLNGSTAMATSVVRVGSDTAGQGLTVHVFDASSAQPLAGASVIVT